MTDTDHQLWRAALDGDEAAFGALFDRHLRAVYNHAFRVTGSWSLAEDVAQTTFLTAWRKRAQVRLVDGSPLPWLLVVAGNHARSEGRALTRWRNRLLRSPTTDTAYDHADDVAGRLDDERRMRSVLAAVDRLPRAEREAVALCLWSGVGYPEAAAVLGISEASVRSRVSRARGRLTRLLAPLPPPDAAGAPDPSGRPGAGPPASVPRSVPSSRLADSRCVGAPTPVPEELS